jgi:hypothetical protein
MARKKWMNGDFLKVQSLKEQNIPCKIIASQLNVTTNALYKALKRLHGIKCRKNTDNHMVNFITVNQLIQLSHTYNVPSKNGNLCLMLNEINECRKACNLSKLVLYNTYDLVC